MSRTKEWEAMSDKHVFYSVLDNDLKIITCWAWERYCTVENENEKYTMSKISFETLKNLALTKPQWVLYLGEL